MSERDLKEYGDDLSILGAEGVTNIDFLSCGKNCGQNCRQCFYKETQGQGLAAGDEEFITRFVDRFKFDGYFIYPREISTSLSLLPLMKRAGQKSVLTNGVNLGRNPQMLDLFEEYGIRGIKFTLFADASEQNLMNGNSVDEYETIKRAVYDASRRRFETSIFNILYRGNLASIPGICDLSQSLGAKRVDFLRLIPVGNASSMPIDVFPQADDMEEAFYAIEEQKERFGRDELFISMGMDFGPDFSSGAAKRFLEGEKQNWVKSKYLCPAINSSYMGISTKTGNVYSCFKLISDPEFVIGKVEGDDILIDSGSKERMSEKTLRERLRGKCAKDSCEYQSSCLGGCRTVAYSMAKLRGEQDPLYAGMDFCRSNMGVVK